MKHSKEIIEDLVKVQPIHAKVDSLTSAYRFCENIAKHHYENFPVGSLLIPKKNRRYFYAVYAFSRLGDDIGDEYDYEPTTRLELLDDFQSVISQYCNDRELQGNPIALALADTVNKKNIPLETLFRLLEAFRQDIQFKNPSSIEDLHSYCHFSANPVGELVLRISDEYSPQTLAYSDKICTALQLINFWQDISRDKKIGRIYIPSNLLAKYNLTVDDILNSGRSNIKYFADNSFDSLLQELFAYTRQLMKEGSQITKHIKNRRLRGELTAIYLSATLVLNKCERLGTRLLIDRPAIRKTELLKILPKVSLSLLR